MQKARAIGMDSDLDECDEKAAVVDGSGYFGAIRVKDDFGCIYFEQS